jgi:hypothetical protein
MSGLRGPGKILTIALFGILMAGPTEAAKLVVVSSTVPELVPGQVIDGTSSINVGAGQSVSIVAPGIEPVAIEGPFSGAPESRDGLIGLPEQEQDAINELASLFVEDTSEDGKRAIRRRGKGPKNAWDLNVAVAGNHCIRPTKDFQMWRPNAGQSAQLSIKDLATKKRFKTTWPAKESYMSWPKEVKVEDGATYLLKVKGATLASKLQVHIVPKKFPTTTARVVWMSKHGCKYQAKRMISRRR